MVRGPSPGIALPGNRWDLVPAQPTDPAPSVSVVVAHYRQQDQLDRTLHAIMHQDHRGPVEIIVVDDGSPEPPLVPSEVQLIVQKDRGFRLARARNMGAQSAANDIICFLDADTTPESGYLRALTRLPALAPDCVTVGRRRHADLTGVAPPAEVRGEGLLCELADPAWLREGYRLSGDLLNADDRSYRFMIGAVLACRRDLFFEIGGFNETFATYGGEDWEWAYRAWLAGAVFAHVPDAVAWHDGPAWPEREQPDQQRAKNAETLRLSELIPIPGSRGRGMRPAHADILIDATRLTGSDAVRFQCVDSLLADLPEAQIGTRADDGPGRDEAHDRVRILIEVHHGVRVSPGALRAAVDRLVSEQLGRVRLVDDSGSVLLSIVSTRAAARHARWGTDDLFGAITLTDPRVQVIEEEPDLEAYLGGWG